MTPGSRVGTKCPLIEHLRRHVAQWESASLTRKRSAVQSRPCLLHTCTSRPTTYSASVVAPDGRDRRDLRRRGAGASASGDHRAVMRSGCTPSATGPAARSCDARSRHAWTRPAARASSISAARCRPTVASTAGGARLAGRARGAAALERPPDGAGGEAALPRDRDHHRSGDRERLLLRLQARPSGFTPDDLQRIEADDARDRGGEPPGAPRGDAARGGRPSCFARHGRALQGRDHRGHPRGRRVALPPGRVRRPVPRPARARPPAASPPSS